MIYSEVEFDSNFNSILNELKKNYDSISNFIVNSDGLILNNKCKYNNKTGDITKNIKWTWAINSHSLNLFEVFTQLIIEDINNLFNNEFKFYGASFITIFDKEVDNSDFHIDVNSQYDTSKTNILTIIFPIYIDNNMGGLEYKHKDIINIYKYKKNACFIWDSCKLIHRTEPYKISESKKRVLVSLNLVSDESWARTSIKQTLNYQGNIPII
jgi:hypothetical protein